MPDFTARRIPNSDTTVLEFEAMKPLTMQQAAETTGWSQRMLRYLEQAGLVNALRTHRAGIGSTANGRSSGCVSSSAT